MSDATQFDLDPIDELRLRRWARQHYVADTQRDRTWHSVILDEMQRKDDEARQREISRQSYGAMVPLAPHVASHVASHGRELPGTRTQTTTAGVSLRIDAPQDDD